MGYTRGLTPAITFPYFDDRGIQHPLTVHVHQDDVIKWKYFPRHYPFVQGIHRHREFTAQRPVTHSFDVFFDLSLNKRLSKQSRGWWFETPSRQLWRHCNVLGYTVCGCCMEQSLNVCLVLLCEVLADFTHAFRDVFTGTTLQNFPKVYDRLNLSNPLRNDKMNSTKQNTIKPRAVEHIQPHTLQRSSFGRIYSLIIYFLHSFQHQPKNRKFYTSHLYV